MGYKKILSDGREVNVPYWHGYCEKHNCIFLLRNGCESCKEEELKRDSSIIPKIKCLSRKCPRSRSSGFRFRGYLKCFGCPHARATTDFISWKKYDSSNFNLEELKQAAKRRRQQDAH